MFQAVSMAAGGFPDGRSSRHSEESMSNRCFPEVVWQGQYIGIYPESPNISSPTSLIEKKTSRSPVQQGVSGWHAGRALQPDLVTQNAELWALAKGRQWQMSLQRFRCGELWIEAEFGERSTEMIWNTGHILD